MSELRECPFCGEIPSLSPVASGKAHQYTVECNNGRCHAQPFVVEIGEGRAVSAWNTRPADAVREAAKNHLDALALWAASDDQDPDSDEWKCVQRSIANLAALVALAQDGRG